jgi:hypothetical protein
MSESVNRAGIRRSVRRAIQTGDGVTRSEVVDTVARRRSVPESDVRDELEALEEHGFIYPADMDADDPEVRIP